MDDIFRKILDMRSYHGILYLIDDAIDATTPEEKLVFEKMRDTNKLDEVYALAHEHLGEHEKAAELREWLKNQAKKPKPSPMF